jgi:hypothetical protein
VVVVPLLTAVLLGVDTPPVVWNPAEAPAPPVYDDPPAPIVPAVEPGGVPLLDPLQALPSMNAEITKKLGMPAIGPINNEVVLLRRASGFVSRYRSTPFSYGSLKSGSARIGRSTPLFRQHPSLWHTQLNCQGLD